MAMTSSARLIFLILLLFLAMIDATLSLKEWKKFENGKVQSQNHKVIHLTKNKTEDEGGVGRQQHILHSHHGEKLNRHQVNNDKLQPPEATETTNEDMTIHKPNKDRHHRKNAEKMLHSGHRGEINKQPAKSKKDKTKKLINIMPDENDQGDKGIKKKASSKTRTKPEGMSSIQWRRIQKEDERRKLEKARSIAESWLNKTEFLQAQKAIKKKPVIRKMEGNKSARKLWKEAFRGPDRLVLK